MQLKVEKFHFKLDLRDFPGSLAAKTPKSQCRGLGPTPGQGMRSHVPLGVTKKKNKFLIQTNSLKCVSKQP